jgi:hypothetical protein
VATGVVTRPKFISTKVMFLSYAETLEQMPHLREVATPAVDSIVVVVPKSYD